MGRELELPQSDDSGSPLRDLEKRTIVTALEMSQGSKQDAARRLKISRSKLWRKMKIYGITDADFKK